MAEAFDILKHLEARASLASPFRVRKFVGAPAPMGVLAQPKEKPLIDRKRMCVTKVITTQAEDRSRDVVITRGIDCANHKSNPVVLLEHAQQGYYKLPVGKAMDPDGNYTVKLYDGFGTGQTWYSQSTLEGEQTFALVDEGVLPGASIGFRPRKARPLPWDGDGLQPPGLLLEEVELLEYSDCVLPDNPECAHVIAEVLGKNVLCGKPISEVLYKSLSMHAPRFAAWAPGFTPTENHMAQSTPAAPAVTAPPVVVKSAADITDPALRAKFHLPPAEAAKPAAVKKSVGADGNEEDSRTPPGYTPMGDRADEAGAEEGDEPKKPGARALMRHHDHLMECCEKSAKEAESQEHEGVARLLSDHDEKLRAMAEEAAEKHGEYYPHEKPLRDKDDPADEKGDEEGGDAPRAKSFESRPDFLRYRKRLEARQARVVKKMRRDHMACCMKAAGFLDDIAGHQGPWTDTHQAAAAYHANELKSLCAKSEGMNPMVADSTESDIAENGMKALRDENAALKALLAKRDALIPTLKAAVKSLQAKTRLLPAG